MAVPEVVCCCESSGGQILRHETGVALRPDGVSVPVCPSEYTCRLFNYPSILFLHYKLANRYPLPSHFIIHYFLLFLILTQYLMRLR